MYEELKSCGGVAFPYIPPEIALRELSAKNNDSITYMKSTSGVTDILTR
jgi:deoxyinosine 3'endonuclease (endonuclease V)